MKVIKNRKVYDTEKATLIASDRYWDGNNMERNGRNTYLYKTKNGAFFFHNETCWQGERDSITPCSETEAVDAYETYLTEHAVEFEVAFSVELEEA